jgi:predicted 3-demethylubiquinone-9 3-methyltransferase (glyoxalase superfamily)
MQKIVTNLWFDTQAEEAAYFYTSIFKNSKINAVTHYGEAGPREAGMVMTVDFEIDGVEFTGINGGPEFKFDEAISLLVNCEDQAEIDELWEKLTADGGEEGVCGWCKDKFGLSWQIVPKSFSDFARESSPEELERAMQAVLQMKKFDVAALESAVRG